MNNPLFDKQNKYRKKYKYMKQRVKALVFENAALCDEVAKIQESIVIVKEERKFLLRKLLEYECEPETQMQCKSESGGFTNIPKVKLKKRRSHEDGGKT